ncbi:MAG: hypothetical protein Kow0062_10880 [Acidobacteriota bacterium]
MDGTAGQPPSESSCSSDDATCPADAGPVLRFATLAEGALFAGRWRIVRRLGAGGTAEVFEVFDEVAGEQRALKVLFPRPGDDDASLERLRRELRAMHALRHPGIPDVYDIGVHEGLVYLVLELLDGESLRDRLAARGTLPPDEAVRILDGLLDALAAAHARGIVHRDVKPGNVLLARTDDGEERVVVLDFGLARGEQDARLTRTGAFLGTPEYASPEQVRGEPLTPASDVYATGVVLWQMLAGSPPFTGSSEIEVLGAHASRPLPAPRRALAGAPRWLRDLAVAMLEKDPRRRPHDAGEALARLRRRRRTALARRVLRAFGTRRAAMLAALAALLLVLGAVLLVPVRVEARGTTISGRSAAGLPIWRTDVPLPLAPWRVPMGQTGFFSRRWMLGLDVQAVAGHRVPFPPEFPAGLVRVDLLPGRTDGRIGEPAYQFGNRENPHGFPFYDRAMELRGLARLPVGTPDGVPLFYGTWQHREHFPCVVYVFDTRRNFGFAIRHPGYLASPDRPVIVPGEPSLLVLSGVNNLLGMRPVVLAVPLQTARWHGISIPPQSVEMEEFFPPTYYTPVPGTSFAMPSRLVLQGNTLTLVAPRRSVRIAARTGVPLDERLREGLPALTWARQRERLWDLVLDALGTRISGQPDLAAERLEAFAEREQVAATFAGIALARAAEVRREQGSLEQALADAERAAAFEPEIQGHIALQIDLLARLERWQSLERLMARLGGTRIRPELVARTLCMALLLDDRASEARSVAGQTVPPESDRIPYEAMFPLAMADLHADHPERVPGDISGGDRLVDPGEEPVRAFLLALAAVTSDPARPSEAARLIARHRAGFGGGAVAPIVPLRALLGAWGAGELVPDAEVDLALEAQQREAKRDLRSLYWLAWARALAARAALEQGDRERHARLAAAARASRGVGPWLERVLQASP